MGAPRGVDGALWENVNYLLLILKLLHKNVLSIFLNKLFKKNGYNFPENGLKFSAFFKYFYETFLDDATLCFYRSGCTMILGNLLGT